MTDAHTLLEQYVAAHAKGEATDPLEWLDRLPEGGERAKLTALIDAYLERAPMRAWDPEAFRASGLAPFAEHVNSALYSQAGTWPAVLPALREKVRIKRADLVAQLAAALGVGDKQAKVGAYYHEMETGSLPSEGVNDKVLDALGSILGQSGEALRRAGLTFHAGSGDVLADAVEAPSFARTPSEDFAVLAQRVEPPDDQQSDEVDRLFRGY